LRLPRLSLPPVPRATFRVTVAVLAAGAVLSLAAIGAGGRVTPTYHHYVALGDSFTAAPYVPLTDIAYGCYRSTNNYPHLVADALHIEDAVDRSCTGANTNDMTGRQVTSRGMSVPPQFTGLSRYTDLVTIGLGFNNDQLYARMNTVCRLSNRVCPLYDRRGNLSATVDKVQSALVGVIDGVKEIAPHARILLITYPGLLPRRGSCPQLPRFRPQDRATYRAVQLRLRAQMRAAAEETRIEFVDFYRDSIGHDICARHPWVQGKVGSRYHGAAMHPLAAGQHALARIIESRLRLPPPNGRR
jgi:GDSL-like lipase/acylhydrolase family protein